MFLRKILISFLEMVVAEGYVADTDLNTRLFSGMGEHAIDCKSSLAT